MKKACPSMMEDTLLRCESCPLSDMLRSPGGKVAASEGFPEFWVRSFLKNLEMIPSTPMCPQSGDIGRRRRQEGAAAHACPEMAVRTATAETSGLGIARMLFPACRGSAFHARTMPAARRSRKAKQGARGEMFPPHAFSVLPLFCLFTGRSSPWRIRRDGGRSCRARFYRALRRYVPSGPFCRARGRRGR